MNLKRMFVLILSIVFILSTQVYSKNLILSMKDDTSTELNNTQLKITGEVKYEDLEGGFYKVNDYRLSGNFDFSKFLGKKVNVIGELDTSPSIYMTKTIEVEGIEVIKQSTSKSKLKITGIVKKNNLEGGFYEVKNYRLTGDYDFSKYQGKEVIVVGTKDTSPSIYMTKAIKVEDIQVVKVVKEPIEKNLTKISGVVEKKDLEGGFYEVDRYRLIGDYDFNKYLGKVVSVSGQEDNSPSIYMTKALKVNNIEKLNTTKYKNNLQQQIQQSISHINNLEKNMPEYIKQHGKESSQVRHYKEEIKILRNDVKKALKELILLDGSKVDLEKYKKLGKVINSKNKLNIFVNGKELKFEQSVLPFIEKGTTLVSLREIMEELNVQYNIRNRMIKINKNDIQIRLYKGKRFALVNNKFYRLKVPPKVVQNKTVVPLRFVAETLNSNVEWIPEGRIIAINEKTTNNIEKLTSKDFIVTGMQSSVKLEEWDDGLKGKLGEPITQEVEKLVTDADTFAGSYFKYQKYNGLKLRLMSPKDNGERYFIDKIVMTKPNYSTNRGVKVGDNYTKILNKYGDNYINKGSKVDQTNSNYCYKDQTYKSITFEVKDKKVETITLKIQHP